MEGFGWIMTIILGGLAGWIAEKVMNFDTGLIMNIVLGIVGALLGNWLLALAGISTRRLARAIDRRCCRRLHPDPGLPRNQGPLSLSQWQRFSIQGSATLKKPTGPIRRCCASRSGSG